MILMSYLAKAAKMMMLTMVTKMLVMLTFLIIEFVSSFMILASMFLQKKLCLDIKIIIVCISEAKL